MEGSTDSEKSDLPEVAADWTGLRPSELRWWNLHGRDVAFSTTSRDSPKGALSRVGSIDSALNGREFDYPRGNPLDPMWWKKSRNEKNLISSLVTLRGGKIANGRPKLRRCEGIYWQFEDDGREGAHRQRLTDSVDYALEMKRPFHVITIGSGEIRLQTTAAQARCWILNVPFKSYVSVDYKSLKHFKAYYDLLTYEIANSERPVPTTDVDYLNSNKFGAARDAHRADYRPMATSDSVYCPGGMF